jgi:DNA-binding response OmpR family regulator
MEETQTILLVDDESAITDNLAPFLERSGFEVSVAADGEQALKMIAELKPDVLVLDVLMPRLDGREVLRRLRSEGNWIPILLLTQVGEAGERAMALEEGARAGCAHSCCSAAGTSRKAAAGRGVAGQMR